VPGLYLHIPFCARRCPYCDFAVSVNARPQFQANYVAALQIELKTALQNLESPLESVFLGGGTPTQLPASTLNQILATARPHLAPDSEVSLEANPENLDAAYLRELRRGGWNRLSLGAQSFDAHELQVLGRVHDGAKIENVVRQAKEAGFEHLSLDLIYGAPGTSLTKWQQTLRRAVELDVAHLSAYSLTIEDGTAFGRAVRKGELAAPDDDFLADLMDEATQILGEAGFGRYEVSNWAKAGFECVHNLNYWRGGDYLGVGCGAHGHQRGHRFWNERDAKTYIRKIESEGSARAGEEFLTPRERASELVALGLRCREGFEIEQVARIGAFDARKALNGALSSFVLMGTLREEAGRVSPSPQALAVADGVAARLVAHF
jgi:oxygen-independent coproporphyrinogen-3 oxidase